MKKRLNKIPTNYSVALSEQEVVNLSETLSAVRTAGGGTGGVYIGDGQYIGVDNTNNRISFLPDAATKLESVSDKLDKSTYAADSATFLTAHQSLSGYYQKTETSSKEQLSTEFEKYQTVAGMDQYLTEVEAQSTYLTKSNADTLYAPLSTTADVEVLKSNSGNFSQYYKKTETSSKEELSAEFNKYQTKADMDSYATDQDVVNLQLNLEQLISTKQPKLTFGYNENNAISSINDSALAGQGGTTYSAGAGIAIIDEYISLSADYIQAITQVSGKQDELEFTYDNSGSIIKINNSAIAGGAGGSVSYTGRNGVEINGNYIELETTAKNAIDSVGGIATDVGTLKTASANWNKVSDKLDTTAFSTVSGNFLTAHQSLDDYATKSDINDMATQTWVGQQGFYTKASGDNDYAPKSVTATVNTLTGASAGWNEVTAKLDASVASTTYQTKEDMNDYLTKSEASTTYQPTGNYLIADDITGKLDKSIYANASGNWENTYNTIRQYSAAGTWLTAHQSLTDYYTKSQTSGANEIENALNGKQDKLTFAGESNTITSINNSAVGGGTSFTGVTTAGSISGDGLTNPLGLVTSAENALTSVASKVDKPTSLANKYLVLRTDSNGAVSGWCDFQDQSYSKTETQDTFIHRDMLDNKTGGTLTGSGLTGGSILGVNTNVIQTKLTDAQLSAISSVSGKVDIPTAASADNKYLVYSTKTTDSGWCELSAGGDYLPLSGGTVTGDVIVKSTGTNLLAVNTTATLMGQSRVNNLTDTTAIGTNWLGVNSNGGGFLKNVQGGNVGALNGTSIQIDFAPNGNTAYGNITVNSQDNISKIVHVPTASYNSMSSFDNTNGPNYMLRKTASGFDIGAAVINVTQLPATTEANAYYFVYDA